MPATAQRTTETTVVQFPKTDSKRAHPAKAAAPPRIPFPAGLDRKAFTAAKFGWLSEIAVRCKIPPLGFQATFVMADKYLNREHGTIWVGLERLALLAASPDGCTEIRAPEWVVGRRCDRGYSKPSEAQGREGWRTCSSLLERSTSITMETNSGSSSLKFGIRVVRAFFETRMAVPFGWCVTRSCRPEDGNTIGLHGLKLEVGLSPLPIPVIGP
jgi:hypothetical protein